MAPECVEVFKIVLRLLAREFESIETSPGFAQLLGENWVIKKSIIFQVKKM